MEFSVPAQWLGIAALILAGVQGVKKLPFLGPLMEKFMGAWWGLALTAVAAFVQGVVLYSGDSTLTGAEMIQIVVTTLGAMGMHFGASKAEGKVGLAPTR